MRIEDITLTPPWGRDSVAGWALLRAASHVARGELCPVIGAGSTIAWQEFRRTAGGDASHFLEWTSLVKALVEDAESRLAEAAVELRDLDGPLSLTLSYRNEQALTEALSRRLERLPNPDSQSMMCPTCSLGALGALAIAIASRAPGRRFHIITTNFDCLLEESISQQGARAEALAPGSNRSMTFGRSRLGGGPPHCPTVRVLHVHGALARDGSLLGPLVLDSRSYERLTGIVAAAGIRELAAYSLLPCLFYGFSFVDQAVRARLRLARFSGEEGGAAEGIPGTTSTTFSQPPRPPRLRWDSDNPEFTAPAMRHIALVRAYDAGGVVLSRSSTKGPEVVRAWLAELMKLGVQPVPSARDDYLDQALWLRQLADCASRRSRL